MEHTGSRLVSDISTYCSFPSDAYLPYFIGRFLQPHSADDILFGNVFERPLKLPWVFGAALRFMK